MLAALKDRAGCLVRGKGIFSTSGHEGCDFTVKINVEKSIELRDVMEIKIGGIKHLSAEEALRTARCIITSILMSILRNISFCNISTDELDAQIT